MTVDTASRALIEAGRASAAKPREEMTVAEQREAVARMRAAIGDGPDMAEVSDLGISVCDTELPARLYTPCREPRGLIVYYHGGGWVAGSLTEFDPLCRAIAAATGCAVISVQYRKSPEFAYPVPVDDAWQSLQWISVEAAARVGPGLPLIVAGDSAGANLAIATTLRARAAGAPTIAAQVLLYPVTDSNFDRSSYVDPENQLSLTRGLMIQYWDHYVGDLARRDLAEVSPLRCVDLGGLPPAIVLTAEYDVLRDEGEAYAARLLAAGVPVLSRRFEGQMHAFAMFVDLLPGSARAIEFIGDNLPRLLQNDVH